MVHRLNRLRGRDDGAVALVFILLTSMVFIGLCSMVLDLGLARDTRGRAQNAADASALAAGNALYLNGAGDVTNAIAAAKSYAATNYEVSAADWAACIDALALTHHPGTPCISFNSATAPTAVRVSVPLRQIQTPFAGMWGVSSIPVGAAAQIQVTSGLARCGLCVIGTGEHALQNGSITINGAGVMINGTLTSSSNGGITVTGTGAAIGLDGATPLSGTFSPVPLANQAPIADPLALMPMPDYSALVAHTNSCTQGPGIYVSLTACPGGMLPGLYVLTGTTSGNIGVVASGVTLYTVCSTSGVPRPCASTGESGGTLAISGNGYLNITAPTTGQPNKGLAIVADRKNTATLSFGGNGAANSGTVYALSGSLAYNGNAGIGTDSLIIVGTVTFAGNPAAFVSSYTEANNVSVPLDLHLS